MTKGFSIVFSKSTLKDLESIPTKFQIKILSSIQSLQSNPFLGEKLWGKLDEKRKLKIWPYRVIYMIDEGKSKVVILEIGHRQGIYG